MSIHVRPSEEAEAQMKIERRNSSIVSIFISVSVIVLIFLVLGYFLIPNIPKPIEGFIVQSVPKEDVTPIKPEKVNNPSRSKPSAPPSSAFQQRNIVSLTTDLISIPVVDINPRT